VDVGNVNQIKEALLYLLNNPEIAHMMGKKAREKVTSFFAWTKTVSTIEKFLLN